jgi:hypothetical protein
MLLYAFYKRINLTNKKNLFFIGISMVLIVLLFLYAGAGKIKSDIATTIKRLAPKKAEEVYRLLFPHSTESCITVINFNDQVIPKIDCCIWIEVRVCSTELNRIRNLKKYQETKWNIADSLIFLKPFEERPEWWDPKILGDSMIKLYIQFNQDKEQTLFFGRDSSHAFICDQAL